MGITREDLVYDVGRHVDDSHNFEAGDFQSGNKKATKERNYGKPVRSGPVVGRS